MLHEMVHFDRIEKKTLRIARIVAFYLIKRRVKSEPFIVEIVMLQKTCHCRNRIFLHKDDSKIHRSASF